MKHERLEGEALPATLDEIEAWRSAQIGLIRADYFAGKRKLIPSCHLIDDVNRDADKARDDRIKAILYRKAAA